MKKIAVINTVHPDGLARTVLDGLVILAQGEEIVLRLSSPFRYPLALDSYVIPREDFIPFARGADCIVILSSKYGTDIRLAENVDRWDKTVFVDGGEMGGNNRFDALAQARLLSGSYIGLGGINHTMRARCAAYFRREKPYVPGVVPLPFGIESRYVREYAQLMDSGKKKDIDFFCVFGQDEYPLLRRVVREEVVRFCRKEGFTCETGPLPKEEFYRKLARSKVGVSVGGGGFDTFRFWEILGANALLLTETIDIFPKYANALNYKRIREFNNLFDFAYQLPRVGAFLKGAYDEEALAAEYEQILTNHSSRTRALTVINAL